MKTAANRKSRRLSRGKIFIVSAPSGAGKTTLCQALLRRHPELNYSISHTTRAPRPGETDGVDYHFITPEDFAARIEKKRWAEWAQVHGNYYGTSKDNIDEALEKGEDILLDIDVQGARQIRSHYPDAVTIFIVPPDMDALRKRLQSRGTDSPEVVQERMQNAVEELSHQNEYRHVVINEHLPLATEELATIFQSYRQMNTNRK